jgi:hypothetical protein
MARVPSYAKTTALVSRALTLTPQALVAAFVPAAQHDLPQLAALRRQVIGSALTWDDPRYLAWRYHLGAADGGRGECWVVKRDGEVLAMLGSERITLLHDGHRVEGLSVMDIAVRPEIDGIGLGVWMAMHLCEQSDCVLAIGSNSNSRALVSNVFVRLPDRRSYAHLIEFRPTLRRRWRSTWLAHAGAALAGWSMAAWRGVASLQRERALRIEPLARFDASLDTLLAQARGANEITLARDAAFLNWRLFDSPRSAYTVRLAHDAAGPAGYIALRVRPGLDGCSVLVIEDLLVRHGSDAVLRALVCHAFEHAARERCERISVIACHLGNERVLRRMGFFAHRADAETLSVRCRDARLGEAIAAGAPWHLTGANTDRDD